MSDIGSHREWESDLHAQVGRGMRHVMVTGSRDWTDAEVIDRELSAIAMIGMVIHGCATGADTLAAEWAAKHGRPPVGIPALWDYYGRSAGPIRNGWLLDLKPDIVIAFPLPSSRGTWDAVEQAGGRGIPVRVVRDYLP